MAPTTDPSPCIDHLPKSPAIGCTADDTTSLQQAPLLSHPLKFASFPVQSKSPEEQGRRKKKPYKELTLEEKVTLIKLAERNTNLSQASIAEKYCIAKSNVCRILQRKLEYLRAYETAGFAGSRKRKLRGAEGSNGLHRLQKVVLAAEAAGDHTATDQGPLATANNKDNESVRVHMFKEHQLSRVFMCSCCNYAFPDKFTLHNHVTQRQNPHRPKPSSKPLSKDLPTPHPLKPIIAAVNQDSSWLLNHQQQPVAAAQVPSRPVGGSPGAQPQEPGLVHAPQQQSLLMLSNFWRDLLVCNGQPSEQVGGSALVEDEEEDGHRIIDVVAEEGSPSSHTNTSSSSMSTTSSSSNISPTPGNNNNTGKSMEHISDMVAGHHACDSCDFLKAKVQGLLTRCNYLEVYNGGLQSEIIRISSKSSQCVQKLEIENSQLKNEANLMRLKLLECRQKIIQLIQMYDGQAMLLNNAEDRSSDTERLSEFIGDLLNITLIQ